MSVCRRNEGISNKIEKKNVDNELSHEFMFKCTFPRHTHFAVQLAEMLLFVKVY